MIAAAILFTMGHLVDAQYNYQGGYGGGGGGSGGGFGGGHEGEMDERPKVNLGIRLRIPAFKFELPRFSLPKITVSAKIRQPDGPRVIQLPEINLDTSSKSELPSHKTQGGGHGSGGAGGGGGYGNQYQGPAYGMSSASSYGGGDEKSGMISFSTEEERPDYNQYPAGSYKNTYRPPAATTFNRYQAQRHHQPPSYSPSSVQSSYSVFSKPAGSSRAYQHHVQQEPADKNPELGFNSPAYAGAS